MKTRIKCWLTQADLQYGSVAILFSSLSAPMRAEIDTDFHSASGIISCREYTSEGSVALALYGGMRRLSFAAALASSSEQQRNSGYRFSERSPISDHVQNSPCVGNFSVFSSILSCRCPATLSMADTSTLFLSIALIDAFAFLVPNASPSAARASRRCKADTSADSRPFRAFTCLVNRCNGAARTVVVLVRLL